MTPVYLSPHHDDICFSLGWTAMSRPGGHLVNIFSRSNYTADGICSRRRSKRIVRLICRTDWVVDRVSRIRALEDQSFTERCRLTRHDLGLRDALLAGKPTRDLTGIEPDVAVLERRLIDFLLALAEREGLAGTTLYCPIGIGGHRDHVATMMAVLKAQPRLRERFTSIRFYEDLHYASDTRARTDGLDRFTHLCPGQTLKRHIIELSNGQFEEKLQLVALYASQHARLPVPESYSPAGSEGLGPHEACWELPG